MIVKKYQLESGLMINFHEDTCDLSISFQGNFDLYWSIRSKEAGDKHSFVITKENYQVYLLFDKLYSDIKNINIFGNETEEDKDYYRNYNASKYRELFNEDTKTITWYSDEVNHDVSNFLKIKKENDTFKLDFFTQNDIEGYDRDFKTAFYIPIRFRNSGSSYDPFNCVFMNMYNDLKDVDDVLDYGHQIHIGEILYKQKIKHK